MLPVRFLALVLLFVATVSSHAAVIAKLPFTINKPGNYVLSRSLNYTGTGYAITVNASDVNIDLRGFVITSVGDVSATNETAGVYAIDKKNITIRNGTFRGFFRGIYLEQGAGFSTENHTVENIRVESSTFLGIQVKGRGSIIRNNSVIGVSGAINNSSARFGLHLTGDNLRVSDNFISRVVPAGNSPSFKAIGIQIASAGGAVVERNRVVNVLGAYTIHTIGLDVFSSERSLVEGNSFSTWGTAVNFSPLANPGNRSVYRNNTHSGGGVGYTANSAADDGGGNY